MLSLDPPTSFVAKRKASTLLGVDANPESRHVVATFTTSVALIEVDDNKVVRSWSCTRGRRNTSAAIFAVYESEFVVIQNGNVLRTFSEAHEDFGDSFTLNHKAHSLVRCQGHNPLVMLENGSLHRLRNVLENPRGIVQQNIEGMELKEILYTCSFVQSTDDIVVCSICLCHHEGYALLMSKVPKDGSPVSHQYCKVDYKASALKAASAHEKGNTSKIVTIWEDGCVCLLSPQFLHDRTMGVKIEKVASLEVDGSVAMTSLSQHHAAVFCKESLAIVDLEYGTVHCKTCIESQQAKLFAIRNYVILDLPGQLRKSQFSIAPVTLSSVLLKRKPSEGNRGQICVKWSDSPTQKHLLTDDDSALVQTLIESKDKNAFDKAWARFWKGKSQRFRQEFCLSSSMRSILSRFQATREKMDFWPRSGLLRIIATGLMNGRWCEGMMQRALEDQDWLFLRECFKHLNSISEEIMIASISHAIRCETPEIVNGSDEQPEDGLQSLPRSCINQVLQRSYSENVLRRKLASLTFDVVLGLIEYLTSVLEGLSLFSTDLTFDQVISWLGMLLDSHLSEILVLEDSWPAIHRLCEATKLQGLVFKELSLIDSVLVGIQSKLVTAKRPKNALYSIEVMKI